MVSRTVDAWGRTTFTSEGIIEMLMAGGDIDGAFVQDAPEIEEYKKWCQHFRKEEMLSTLEDMDLSPEDYHAQRATEWLVSDTVRDIEVRNFLLSCCTTDEQRDRVNLEMDMFEERGLIPLLQLMIFLIGRFLSENIVWGVGRGSSVCSYVLYLIGVHKIDPLKYNLSIKDFLKD